MPVNKLILPQKAAPFPFIKPHLMDLIMQHTLPIFLAFGHLATFTPAS
jgi:hypothetical protein